MQHSRSKPPLVAEARSLVWYHIEKVPQPLIAAFLEWCREKDIYRIGRGRTTLGVISLYFDAADSYLVNRWFKTHGIIIRRVRRDAGGSK